MQTHMGGDKKFCQAACRNGKPHEIRKLDRYSECIPISVDAANILITNLFSGIDEVEIPQPWLSSSGDAYACGSHVLLEEPKKLPTAKKNFVRVCDAGFARQGISTRWLKADRPGERQKRREAASQPPPPPPPPVPGVRFNRKQPLYCFVS